MSDRNCQTCGNVDAPMNHEYIPIRLLFFFTLNNCGSVIKDEH